MTPDTQAAFVAPEPKVELNITQIARILVYGGLCLALVAVLASYFGDTMPTSSTGLVLLKNAIMVLISFVEVVAGAAISGGLITLLLEYSTFKHIIVDIIDRALTSLSKKILSADFPLETYSSERLDHIHAAIISQKNENLKIPPEQVQASIYGFIEKKINKLLSEIFVEYYEEHIFIEPDEDNNIFRKRVTTKFKLVNIHGSANRFFRKISFMQDELCKTEDEKRARIRITKVRVNDTDLTEEVKRLVRVEPVEKKYHNLYDYTVGFDRELQECREHEIEMQYEYEVPLIDISHSFRLRYCCKDYKSTINIQGRDADKWVIDLQTFAAFFCGKTDGNFVLTEYSSVLAQLEIKEWVLPGTGWVITLRKKV